MSTTAGVLVGIAIGGFAVGAWRDLVPPAWKSRHLHDVIVETAYPDGEPVRSVVADIPARTLARAAAKAIRIAERSADESWHTATITVARKPA